MKENNKLNIMISLMILVFIMQLFLKPSVHIKDNHLGIQYEIEQINNKLNLSSQRIECNDKQLKIELLQKEEDIRNYKLIIQNTHNNYNNQDERFEKMLNWSLEAREELEQMNYRYAMCYEGIEGHRREDFEQ